MGKNLIWKLVVIGLLVVLAVIEVYPPERKLKPGIDLGGGTSLLNEIDTTGMSGIVRQQAAQQMIRILAVSGSDFMSRRKCRYSPYPRE